jgi:hypothetical protein
VVVDTVKQDSLEAITAMKNIGLEVIVRRKERKKNELG